jgi:hypothetical protein
MTESRTAPGSWKHAGPMPGSDTRCDIRDGGQGNSYNPPGAPFPPGSSRCPEDRAAQLWVGCKGEHVGPVDVCAGHLDRVRSVIRSGMVSCEFCMKAGTTTPAVLIREIPITGDAS